MKPSAGKKDTPKVRFLFVEAMDKATGPERAAYLDQACGENTELRARIETLLDAHERAGGFLKPVAFDPEVEPDRSPLTEGPGTVIGRFKLLEKIGEGGMAVVYMAEQTEPMRRKVALKIIKLGMDTRQVIARFEAERQALAMMDHPSIAKVLDAGATETGRPYFVMELVPGLSITEYCDTNNLSTKDRLGLFLQVCHAVQHAHQKGIIHRDLKPSNVMVTHHDGRPTPKVIDFGIAKATNQRLTEKTLFTRYAHIIGTPAYMSPEQAELSDLDIDTRSDVYSLGVLLYELLTGTTPFSEDELRQAGYVGMQRMIREEEPTKPSTKLSTLGQTLTDVAKFHGSTPDLLKRAIRGDLDWIVMKSLEKDRSRRYQTAHALGLDIQRHLHREPVLARGPNVIYRLQKFVQRNHIAVAAVLTVAFVLGVACVILSMWSEDRLQLAESESFRHRGILERARDSFTDRDFAAALRDTKSILGSKYVGPEAELLYASILAEGQEPDDAMLRLENLLGEEPQIAGAAHALMARVLWQRGSLDAATLEEVDEHRQRAEQLLPQTAEAYFLRAMTAIAIKRKLEMLEEALRLDPGHYESLKLRAIICQASRKYQRMKEDARVMIALRCTNPLGYSLNAIALRELGEDEKAVESYDRAIQLTPREDPQRTKLNAQRCQTLVRMAQYDRVITEARDVSGDSLGEIEMHFHAFCALTALGEYHEADTLFNRITHSDPESRNRFRDWSMKYVFDTLTAGRSWHAPGRKPDGTPFLAMWEAEETYYHVSAKGRRLITDGFGGCWSPDGTKLAFSLGVLGFSGVALFDPKSQETELLIVPGRSPRWSPDGQHIVFVRDCEVLRLSELTTAERRSQPRWCLKNEVWVMNADGTAPRRLARGGDPSWSSDAKHVYYQSRVDNILYLLSIEDPQAQPIPVCGFVSEYSWVSPDNKYVADVIEGSLRIIDLASRLCVSEWAVPLQISSGNWSPDGRQFSLGSVNRVEDRIGLWIYDLDRQEAAKVLSGQVTGASRSPDKTKMLFSLGPPYFEIWMADLDPNLSTVEALGPGRTLEEHYQEMVRFYTRRIQIDPGNVISYLSRAYYFQLLGDREKAHADTTQYRTLMSPENTTRLIFSTPKNLGRVVNSPLADEAFCISADGLELCFWSDRPGGHGDNDIWITKRIAIDGNWGAPMNPGTSDNTLDRKIFSSLSPNGLELYFSDWRSYRVTGVMTQDLWVRTRARISDPWGDSVKLGPPVNSASGEALPYVSSDGLSLYFTSNRPGGLGGTDIWVTTRPSILAPWTEPINLGPPVNSSYHDGSPRLSEDGSTLYFYSSRPGGYGDTDLWQVAVESMVGSGGVANSVRQSPGSGGEKEVVPEGKD